MEVIGSSPVAGKSTAKEYYTWSQFDEDTQTLVRKISQSGKKYDFIYAIPRGGLPLGVVLSHQLSIPMMDDTSFGIIALEGTSILVVDEIMDTGDTLEQFDGYDTVTIYKKKDCPYAPTYWVRENSEWVVFPWEKINGQL